MMCNSYGCPGPGADHRQVASGAAQESLKLRRHRLRFGGRGAGALRQIEDAPVEKLVEKDVAAELHQGPLRDIASEGD
jgi:hypothetical protein